MEDKLMEGGTLSQQQVLSRINKIYHDDFGELAKLVIQPNEKIIWAGDQSELWSEDRGYLGYVIITSYRFLSITFDWQITTGLFAGRSRISYEYKYIALAPPSKHLTREERERRKVTEILLRDISAVERKDFKMRDMTLVNLLISHYGSASRLSTTLYSLHDGQEVYNLLQNSIRERENESSTISDIGDQLTKLAKLFQADLITKEEYEAAKAKLLR
jgi:hypothetical protein